MTQHDEVRRAFVQQAEWCDKLGSRFTAVLMRLFATGLDETGAVGRKVLNWPGRADAGGDSVPLRLAGALHALVRAGRLPGLAALYPPAAMPTEDQLQMQAMAALREAEDDILQWLQHPPQTNEVARSSVLYPGVRMIARRTGFPVELYELGASAGLNLCMDRFGYAIGGERFGESGSGVQLAPDSSGRLPDGSQPRIAARRGCDRNPLSVADPAHAARLLAYIWPDQPERLARADAAIAIARGQGIAPDKADAADWVEHHFTGPAPVGVTRILYHSVAFQYFPDTARARITNTIEAAGARSTPETPLAWLAFELFEDKGHCLTLRLWPGGEQQMLASAHPHCAWIKWTG